MDRRYILAKMAIQMRPASDRTHLTDHRQILLQGVRKKISTFWEHKTLGTSCSLKVEKKFIRWTTCRLCFSRSGLVFNNKYAKAYIITGTIVCSTVPFFLHFTILHFTLYINLQIRQSTNSSVLSLKL
jgi:hypothetical protein